MPIKNNLFTSLLIFLFPTKLARFFSPHLFKSIHPQSRIGFSWISCEFFTTCEKSQIGHFNFISNRRFIMHSGSNIGRMNIISGPMSILLKKRAAIGNRNKILRGKKGVSSGASCLLLGFNSKITSDHYIDCTQSIIIGSNSILAGSASQIWTHAYVHEPSDSTRYRIDGKVKIGNDVYVGSSCIISLGVVISSGVIVGGGTPVARNLIEPGLYVSSPLRMLPRPISPFDRSDLIQNTDLNLTDTVFVKKLK